jgi:protein SCO1/2
MDDNKIKWLFVSAAGFLLLMIAAAVIFYRMGLSDPTIPVFGEVSSFSYTERNGDAFGSEELKNKVSVVNFFFTTCQGPCPQMNGKVAELYRTFKDAPSVQFISTSVDPDRDSLQALKEYALRFGVTDRRWLFLRAPIMEVRELSEKTFMLATGDAPGLHSTKLILIDGEKKVRGYYSSEDPNSLRILETHIRQLIKEP